MIVRADSFNRSRLETTIAPAITSNLDLLGAPGNVLPPAAATGLPKDSVVNVTQLLTIDHERLIEPAGLVRRSEPDQVARGLRLVLDI